MNTTIENAEPKMGLKGLPHSLPESTTAAAISSPKSSRKPVVAVVGRPNVGKSTLFNILTDTRKALVKDQPGVTRDLLIEEAELWGKVFDLVDTGGITESTDLISSLVRDQVSAYLQSVDFILFVVDGRVGLIPEDRDVFRLVNESGKPFVVLANKIDRLVDEEEKKAEFYEFGEEIYAVSFEQRRALTPFLEKLHAWLPDVQTEVETTRRLTIVGKPNVGKSSLINKILGENRVLVSEIAGTTLDSIEIPFQFRDHHYLFVDTAGLRRSSKRVEHLEILSAIKSQESIQRSDVVLLVIDATTGPTEQDAKILQAIAESHKAVIVVANKSDLASVEDHEFKARFRRQIEQEFHFFTDVEIVFTSAQTGAGLNHVFTRVNDFLEKLTLRISTSELNDFFMESIRKAPAPVWGNNNVKFYYLTQTQQEPPSFIAFANHPEGVDSSYRRFLINQIKQNFGLMGIPIRLFVMKSRRK